MRLAQPPDHDAILNVRQLNVRFGGQHILENINLDLYRQQVVTLIGLMARGNPH